MQPTPDEARNGWTEADLTAYLREREQAQTLRAGIASMMFFRFGDKPEAMRNRPTRSVTDFDPMEW